MAKHIERLERAGVIGAGVVIGNLALKLLALVF